MFVLTMFFYIWWYLLSVQYLVSVFCVWNFLNNFELFPTKFQELFILHFTLLTVEPWYHRIVAPEKIYKVHLEQNYLEEI